jgi:hypothetical protein
MSTAAQTLVVVWQRAGFGRKMKKRCFDAKK